MVGSGAASFRDSSIVALLRILYNLGIRLSDFGTDLGRIGQQWEPELVRWPLRRRWLLVAELVAFNRGEALCVLQPLSADRLARI